MNDPVQLQQAIAAVSAMLDNEVKPALREEDFISRLSIYINELITHDFQRLLNLLYRIDVDENKLRALLQLHPDKNAGDLLAELIIERQLQKIRSRSGSKRNDDIPENEKW